MGAKKQRVDDEDDDSNPDDATDVDHLPHFYAPSRARPNDPRLRRLCGQIARVLNIAFGGTCNDDLLLDLVVDSVEPDPDATRVKVTVYPMETRNRIDPEMVLQHLERAQGFLRSEIAATVERKKIPRLVFSLKRPADGGDPFTNGR